MMIKQLLSAFALSIPILATAQNVCTPTVYSGDATYYTLLEAGSQGKCTFVNANVKPYYGAAYTAIYKTADQCGVCLQVTGILGTKTIEIVDECPTCHANGDIDLSPDAFQAIVGPLSIGKSTISWYEVACPWGTDPVSVTPQGSNNWYLKVIVARHKNRIKKVEVKNGATWVTATRGADNGWVAGGLGGYTTYDVKVTDIFDQTVTITGVDPNTTSTYKATSNFNPCSVTDVADYEAIRQVTFYPNPATDIVTFDDVEGIKTLEVFNLQGALVYTESFNGTAARIQANLSSLPTGSYIVSLSNGVKRVYSSTLVKL